MGQYVEGLARIPKRLQSKVQPASPTVGEAGAPTCPRSRGRAVLDYRSASFLKVPSLEAADWREKCRLPSRRHPR